MLACHECYKIALFCGLSPPLNKSRTVVTFCDTHSFCVSSVLVLPKMAVPHSRSQVCSILVILLIVPHSHSQTLAHCLKTTTTLYFVVSHVSHDPRHNLCSSGYGPCPTPALTPWDPLRHHGCMALEVCLGASPALARLHLALHVLQ
jgi:hypothetical protein